jgi:hypothetical protein
LDAQSAEDARRFRLDAGHDETGSPGPRLAYVPLRRADSSRHVRQGARDRDDARATCRPLPGSQAAPSRARLYQGSGASLVSMPSAHFDASAVVHTRSSSRRSPDPLPGGPFPQRSPPRRLTGAACGGLGSPPARRTRRADLHHRHSALRVNDLLHRQPSVFRTHHLTGASCCDVGCVAKPLSQLG